jgi:hypothetical protein
MTELNSSCIDSVTTTKKGTIDIKFTTGLRYRYYGVPENLKERLVRAESHGKFFHTYIRHGGYEYKRLN